MKPAPKDQDLRMDARAFDDMMRKALGATPVQAPPKAPKTDSKTKKKR